ncbi:MAG: hypothetical protein HZA51_11890 [Planctomycetes bacterium]|nr:hypothetical protein [Planctomycetota bacterium]
MPLKLSRQCVVSALLVALAASNLPAQVDHRVNRGNTETGGYQLDKSPQAGSGGFNLSRPGFDYGARANAIITNNVTGIGGFKGYSPLYQNNAFRGDLPSTGLSDFQSRGIGVQDVGSSRTIAPSYFYDPTRTIADIGQIRQGLNAPGSSRLGSTTVPLANPVSPNRKILPNVRDPADRRSQLDTPPIGISSRQTLTPLRSAPVGAVSPAFRAAASSSIFGTVTPDIEPNLPSGLSLDSRLDQIKVGETWKELDLPEAERKALESRPDRGMVAKAKDVPTPSNAPPVTDGRLDSTALAKPALLPLPMDGKAPANLGEDRFADFFNAIRAADQAGVKDLSFEPKAPPSKTADPAERSTWSIPDTLVRKQSEGINQLAAAAKWAKDVLDDPVTTFAGKYANSLNQYMADGEAELHRGDYYRAARSFDVARTIDPFNPLPHLHRGHALAAAGDYVSAVANLELGLKRFPHIAAFKMDLVALVGNRDIFDVRRADLEKRLAVKDQYDLRFLLGYLEWYSGLPEDGMKNLRMAAANAPKDSPIRSFAGLLSGDQPLPELPR